MATELKLDSQLVREGYILAFFSKRRFSEIASEVRDVFDYWLTHVPNDSLKWAITSSSSEELKPCTSATLKRVRKLLDAESSRSRPRTNILICGEDANNPEYSFVAFAREEFEDSPNLVNETNLVELRYPRSFFERTGPPPFSEIARRVGEMLTYDSGYGSLALNWFDETDVDSAGEILRPVAMRHPGFDVHFNSRTKSLLGRRSRGARWLTFLSSDLIQKLDGVQGMKDLAAGVRVAEGRHGVLLQAGDTPPVGDLKYGEDLPLLRSVAKAIEPVTFFDDDVLLHNLFASKPEMLRRWERRFFDDF